MKKIAIIAISVAAVIGVLIGLYQAEPEKEFERIVSPETILQDIEKIQEETPIDVFQSCSGSAACLAGKVTRIIDGDTIHVNGKSIRFSLSSTPELNELGGLDAKKFVAQICPVGSEVLVDEDDGQTEGSYGRMLAVIYCNGVNLNQAVLDSGHAWLSSSFCSKSEFSSDSWAQKHGC